MNRTEPPYTFVVPAVQRDPFETFEMLDILHTARSRDPPGEGAFKASGKDYAAGSWVIKTAQPYGAFAKTMLERQKYPDLRLYPGGPPKPPYNVTGHTLWMLMGVEVDQIEKPFEAALELVKTPRPAAAAFPALPSGAYLIDPSSNAGVHRRRRSCRRRRFRSIAPRGRRAVTRRHVDRAGHGGLKADPQRGVARHRPQVRGAGHARTGDVYRLKPETRIGLWRGANNMPAGWLKWVFEQYGFNHKAIASTDFATDLASQYDAIVLPDGTSRETIVNGLSPERNDKEFAWAYGVGDAGWKKLGDWVRGGGTLVAIGSAVETARALLDLPIEPVLPVPRARRPRRAQARRPRRCVLLPGSLLQNEFNTAHPVAFGMPASWPISSRGTRRIA